MKSTVSRSYVASIKELDRIGMTGVKTFLYVVLAACGASVRSTTPPPPPTISAPSATRPPYVRLFEPDAHWEFHGRLTLSAAGESQTKEGTVTCRVGAISVIDDANVTTLRCISTGTLEGVADTTYEIAATAQGYYVLGDVENGRPIGGMPQTAAELAELTTKHSMRLPATPVVCGIHDASGNL